MKTAQMLMPIFLIVSLTGAPHAKAQPELETAVATLEQMLSEGAAITAIVDALLELGLLREQTLMLVVVHINKVPLVEVVLALVELGMPIAEIADFVAMYHSGQDVAFKIEELDSSEFSDRELLNLSATLSRTTFAQERIELLMSLGLTMSEAARQILYTTTNPGPNEYIETFMGLGMSLNEVAMAMISNNQTMDPELILESLVNSGLPLTDAINMIIATENTAVFEQPLAEFMNQPFGPGAFSNDPLTGTPGGGVSTSQ